MILWEGPDRCGKSTCAMAARRNMPGWSYRHHTKMPAEMLVAYHMWGIADAHGFIHLDRLHLSDYAYRTVYGPALNYTPHKWRLVELALMSTNTRVVVMLDSAEGIRSRWDEDELKHGHVAEGIDQLVCIYHNFVDRNIGGGFDTYLQTELYRYENLMDGDKPTNYFLERMQVWDYEAKLTAYHFPPTIGLGNPRPRFMVVGETPGDAFKGELEPGFPLDRGKASEWMWKAFDAIGLRWWEGYYTNAKEFDDPAHFKMYVEEVLGGPATVLCLGGRAATLAGKANINGHTKVVATKHPMYVRRFEHDNFYEWCAELKSALSCACDEQ